MEFGSPAGGSHISRTVNSTAYFSVPATRSYEENEKWQVTESSK
jgi:hypothetical protein